MSATLRWPSPWTRTQHWLVSAAVVVALLHGVLAAVAGPELIAWLPNHGHISSGMVVAEHSHPWDSGATGETADVIFTPDESAVGSVAASVIPAIAIIVFAAVVLTSRLRTVWPRPVPALLKVAVPPPRY